MIISICISCYRPTQKSVLNFRRVLDVLRLHKGLVECRYLINGTMGSECEEKILALSKKNNSPEMHLRELQENIGIGAAYQLLAQNSICKYVMFTGDDDLVSVEHISESIDFLLQNNAVDIVHQFLDDQGYSENVAYSGLCDINHPLFRVFQAYLGYRFGALPGCIFRQSLIGETIDWTGKLYPWVQLVFSKEVSVIGVQNLKNRITVDPGPPPSQRFNDKVVRGLDYGLNERLQYVCSENVLTASVYYFLLFGWFRKVNKLIEQRDTILAWKMRDAVKLRETNFFSQTVFKFSFIRPYFFLLISVGGLAWNVYKVYKKVYSRFNF